MSATTDYLVTSSSCSLVAGAGVAASPQLPDANGNPVNRSGVTTTLSNTRTSGSFGRLPPDAPPALSDCRSLYLIVTFTRALFAAR